jgi:hypothetical protein
MRRCGCDVHKEQPGAPIRKLMYRELKASRYIRSDSIEIGVAVCPSRAAIPHHRAPGCGSEWDAHAGSSGPVQIRSPRSPAAPTVVGRRRSTPHRAGHSMETGAPSQMPGILPGGSKCRLGGASPRPVRLAGPQVSASKLRSRLSPFQACSASCPDWLSTCGSACHGLEEGGQGLSRGYDSRAGRQLLRFTSGRCWRTQPCAIASSLVAHTYGSASCVAFNLVSRPNAWRSRPLSVSIMRSRLIPPRNRK